MDAPMLVLELSSYVEQIQGTPSALMVRTEGSVFVFRPGEWLDPLRPSISSVPFDDTRPHLVDLEVDHPACLTPDGTTLFAVREDILVRVPIDELERRSETQIPTLPPGGYGLASDDAGERLMYLTSRPVDPDFERQEALMISAESGRILAGPALSTEAELMIAWSSQTETFLAYDPASGDLVTFGNTTEPTTLLTLDADTQMPDGVALDARGRLFLHWRQTPAGVHLHWKRLADTADGWQSWDVPMQACDELILHPDRDLALCNGYDGEQYTLSALALDTRERCHVRVPDGGGPMAWVGRLAISVGSNSLVLWRPRCGVINGADD